MSGWLTVTKCATKQSLMYSFCASASPNCGGRRGSDNRAVRCLRILADIAYTEKPWQDLPSEYAITDAIEDAIRRAIQRRERKGK